MSSDKISMFPPQRRVYSIFSGLVVFSLLVPNIYAGFGALLSLDPVSFQPAEEAPAVPIYTEASPVISPIAEGQSRTIASRAQLTTHPAREPLSVADLQAIKTSLADFSSKLASLANNTTDPSLSDLQSNFTKIQSQLTDLRKEYETQRFSSTILERFDRFQADYEARVLAVISRIKAGRNAQAEIQKFVERPKVRIETPIPFRATEFKGEINRVPSSQFPLIGPKREGHLLQNLVQALTSSNPNPADFAESEEIPFTENLKNLAVSLGNDPLSMFNYVVNTIDYVPYFGSKKGADSTLLESRGNDFDQASLLIGLLRIGNSQGQNQTPARYRQAAVKLSVGEIMDLLGVEDPIVAATIFEKTDIPYVLYVDQNDQPLFFVIEITYVEAYVDYDYTRGIVQGNPGAPKRWVPLAPFLAKFYKSQYLNVLDDMNFDIQTFYENYLNGNYGAQEPIAALKSDIQTYLTANHPDLTPEDTYVQTYRSEEDLEFLPLTLPFEVVSDLGDFSAAAENLKHRIQFSVLSSDNSQTFIGNSINVSRLANQEILLEYIAATPDDQAVIDSFPTMYDVIPLSLVQVKPVIKVKGGIQIGGGGSDPQIQLGRENKLTITFKAPKKELGLPVAEKVIDAIEKSTIAGNTEGIAVNTDQIAPPEIRPNQDSQTSSAVASQKLWKTAQNFLYRLQSSHDELARITGGRFTNAATRAVVFNGISVNYQSGQPYSFNWNGLRIDASAFINYYSHFSTNPELHQKEFMHLFGLQASLDEALIFEDDYQVESISTVKGLKLINTGQISGTQVKKITSSNISDIETLNISDQTKTKLRDAVHKGNVVYVPTQQFTYQSWTGLVYIDIDPDTGFGGYIIGEGLNGGYTATPVEQWPSGLVNFLIHQGLNNLTATIISPVSGQQFTQGTTVPWQASYNGTVIVIGTSVSWTENLELDSSSWPVGDVVIPSGYGTTASVTVIIRTDCLIGTENCDYDDWIVNLANKYEISPGVGMPPGILKAIFHKETQIDQEHLFDPKTSRYEPKRDFQDFSGYDQSINPPVPSRDISSIPFTYYKLPGINSQGQPVTKGSRVDNLPRDYKSTLKNTESGGWQLRGIITTDRNGDGILTVAELYANDYDVDGGIHSQGWPLFGNPPSFIGNFTPQFLISSSYGLGHVMYLEATEALDPQNNKIMKDSYTPHDIVDKPELGIELAASVLKLKFNNAGGQLIPNDNCGGWSGAILGYNPDITYKNDVCGLYVSKYK